MLLRNFTFQQADEFMGTNLRKDLSDVVSLERSTVGNIIVKYNGVNLVTYLPSGQSVIIDMPPRRPSKYIQMLRIVLPQHIGVSVHSANKVFANNINKTDIVILRGPTMVDL